MEVKLQGQDHESPLKRNLEDDQEESGDSSDDEDVSSNSSSDSSSSSSSSDSCDSSDDSLAELDVFNILSAWFRRRVVKLHDGGEEQFVDDDDYDYEKKEKND